MMGKMGKREAGFSPVEVVMVLIIVTLVGIVGYMVYKSQHKAKTASVTTASTTRPATKTPATSTDPYAGWKSYTLQYEKLTLKYPSTWTLYDNSTTTARHDEVTFNAPDNFSFHISDGIQNGGDPLPVVNNGPMTVQYLGNPAYLVFIHPKVPQADGPSVPDTSTVGGAILLGDANNQASFFKDKNVLGGSQYNGVNGPEGSYTAISMGYGGKNNMSIQSAKTDTEYKNSLLVIQSMHY
jgi:hypothetical protein